MEHWSELTAAGLVVQWATLVSGELSKLYLVGLAFWIIERVRPAEPRARFFKRDFRTEVCYPLFNIMVNTPVFTLVLVITTMLVLEPFVPHQALAAEILALPMAAQVLVALVLTDVAMYAEHRFLAHRWLWPYHALHHMPEEVSWLTASRVHPVNALTIAFASALMRWVLGFESQALVVATWLASAIAFWEHSNLDFALPRPWCWIFVSPRYHRWHHASEPQAAGKNFALIFPFIDVLFGTYYCPDRLPRAYGLGSAADEIPGDFLGQLVRPFAQTLERARETLGFRSVRPAS